MNEEITFIEPFAGIGGFRLGLEKASEISPDSQQGVGNQEGRHIPRTQGRRRRSLQKFCCVWSNEWDRYCAKIYEKNFGEAPDTRDIRTVPSREIPDHDLLCAGFPCPTFSVAGKGAGFEDTRGTLFFEIPRIARDKRPRYLLLENVKGLLSHQEGKTFQTILRVLTDLGYRCEWQVLNSRDFGVPQNRERVFIIGCLGGKSKSQIFPIGKTNEMGKASTWAYAIDSNIGKGIRGHRRRTMILQDQNPGGEFRLQKEPCVTKYYGTGGGNVPLLVNTVDCDGYLRDGRRKRVDGKAVLTSIPERRIRRLTPVECERLQGFPDGWTEGVSDTQRYKALGNAVTVNVVEAIGRQLMKNVGRKS